MPVMTETMVVSLYRYIFATGTMVFTTLFVLENLNKFKLPGLSISRFFILINCAYHKISWRRYPTTQALAQ